MGGRGSRGRALPQPGWENGPTSLPGTAEQDEQPATTEHPDPPVESTPHQQRIRDAYTQALTRLNAAPGEWVGLADLREQLPDLSTAEFDAVIRSFHAQRDVLIEEETNQKTLTPRDRDAAVVIGTRAHHVIAVRPELLTPEPARTRQPHTFGRTDAVAAVAGIEAAATREQAQGRLAGLTAEQLAAVGQVVGLTPADSTPTNIIGRAAPRHAEPDRP